MKKETKIDLWFVLALFLVMVIAPVLLRYVFLPRLKPELHNVWGMNVYGYMYRILPWLCIALALVHVFVTKRLSLAFVVGEFVCLYIATTFMSYCLRPEDPLVQTLGNGLIHMILIFFIPASTFILQALGIFVLGQVEEHKAKKQAGS